MSDLARSPGSRPTRRRREQRAYRLVVAGGGAGVATIATGALSTAGMISIIWPFLAALATAICVLAFMRAVKR